jgi:hypothetical protein
MFGGVELLQKTPANKNRKKRGLFWREGAFYSPKMRIALGEKPPTALVMRGSLCVALLWFSIDDYRTHASTT